MFQAETESNGAESDPVTVWGTIAGVVGVRGAQIPTQRRKRLESGYLAPKQI